MCTSYVMRSWYVLLIQWLNWSTTVHHKYFEGLCLNKLLLCSLFLPLASCNGLGAERVLKYQSLEAIAVCMCVCGCVYVRSRVKSDLAFMVKNSSTGV